MSKGKEIQFGSYGKMIRCSECQAMPVCFSQIFAVDGICPKCGGMKMEFVIARPTFYRGFLGKITYLEPGVKEVLMPYPYKD